jgi:endonuclease III
MSALWSPPSLRHVLAELAMRYPAGEVLADPLALLLWENIGYLIDDERRAALHEEFKARVGLSADKIAGADGAVLLDMARRGGMRPQTRVERWRAIAAIVLGSCAGDLEGALRALPLGKARALLKRFPAIGDPGADKILLFCDIAPRPSLESNGVRALARLGFFAEQRSYGASYAAAIGVIEQQGLLERDWLVGAYLALRQHGRTLCKRAAPLCLACPLDAGCAKRVVARL